MEEQGLGLHFHLDLSSLPILHSMLGPDLDLEPSLPGDNS